MLNEFYKIKDFASFSKKTKNDSQRNCLRKKKPKSLDWRKWERACRSSSQNERRIGSWLSRKSCCNDGGMPHLFIRCLLLCLNVYCRNECDELRTIESKILEEEVARACADQMVERDQKKAQEREGNHFSLWPLPIYSLSNTHFTNAIYIL